MTKLEQKKIVPPPPDKLLKRIYWRFKNQGMRWLLVRGKQEIRAPETSLGRFINTSFRKASYILRYLPSFKSKSTLSNTSLLAIYDTCIEPITFDFLYFLAAAEIQRKKLRLKQIHLICLSTKEGSDRQLAEDYEKIISATARRERIINILLPAAWLMPSVSNIELLTDRQECHTRLHSWKSAHIFPTDFNVTMHKSCMIDCYLMVNKSHDISVASYRARPESLNYVNGWLERRNIQKKAISFTLRNYDYNPSRNSNLEAWAEFAAYLQDKGYAPVIIPDTQNMDGKLPKTLAKCYTMREAAWNLGLRLALYESCFVNFSVSSGPAFLFLLDEKVRGIMVKITTPNVPQNEVEYIAAQGFPVNKQLPYTHQFQKRVWKDDNFKILVEEFEMFETLFMSGYARSKE